MVKLSVMIVLLAGAVWAGENEKSYAVILQAGAETNEGKARALHALLYVRELAENGYDVVLVFDGAGTGWAQVLQQPEHPLHGHYSRLEELGVMQEVCDDCAEAYSVKDALNEKQQKLLTGEYEGHPSLVKWIEKGYRVLVL